MLRRHFLTLVLLLLPLGPVCGGELRISTLGDSLTDPYAKYTGSLDPTTGLPFRGYAGDKNWVEQFQALRGGSVTIYNQAVSGAASYDLSPQVAATASLVSQGKVDYASIIIGSNDILNYIGTSLGANPAPFITNLSSNILNTVTALKAAGNVGLVLANLPDPNVTPSFQYAFAGAPAAAALITGMVQAANQAIAQIAAANHIPLIDLYGLSQLTRNPLTIGGVTLSPLELFTPDLFHPGTVMQGLLANTFLEALQRGYGADFSSLRLSDQEILDLAHVDHGAGATYFDVSNFVVANPAPEPATLTLCGIGSAVGLLVWYRRQRRMLLWAAVS